MQLFLEKVKKADRGDQYKMTDRWPLKDLKLVDGKNVKQVLLTPASYQGKGHERIHDGEQREEWMGRGYEARGT